MLVPDRACGPREDDQVLGTVVVFNPWQSGLIIFGLGVGALVVVLLLLSPFILTTKARQRPRPPVSSSTPPALPGRPQVKRRGRTKPPQPVKEAD